jgi:hypothetical protein
VEILLTIRNFVNNYGKVGILNERKFMKTEFRYEAETVREVLPPEGHGWLYEVGPDRDGLGMVEIRVRECTLGKRDDKIAARVSISMGAAQLVAKALIACGEELSNSHDGRHFIATPTSHFNLLFNSSNPVKGEAQT